MTRQMVHAMPTRGWQTKGRREAGLCQILVAAGRSVARGCRTAPAEAVVHTDLDGMLVLAAADADHVGRTGGDGRAAEVVILVFGLGRPARREHVFEAGADGIAILAVTSGGDGLRHARYVNAKAAVTP